MKKTRIISFIITLALVITSVYVPDYANAASKAKPAKKSISMIVGQKTKITIKKKNAKAKYTFKSSKAKVAAVNKKGVVTAKKAGKAVISVKETLSKKTRQVGKVKVTVNKDTPTDAIDIPVPVL